MKNLFLSFILVTFSVLGFTSEAEVYESQDGMFKVIKTEISPGYGLENIQIKLEKYFDGDWAKIKEYYIGNFYAQRYQAQAHPRGERLIPTEDTKCAAAISLKKVDDEEIKLIILNRYGFLGISRDCQNQEVADGFHDLFNGTHEDPNQIQEVSFFKK